MYAEKIKSLQEVRTVLDKLCNDTIVELEKLFGKNYKQKVFAKLEKIQAETYVIKLKKTNEAVGLFGLIPINVNACGVFLLTCDSLHKGNLITFLKSAKKQINEWCEKYKLIMDSCYKQNETIKKWLRLLGFKPSDYQDDNFQVWYRGDISYYED